MHQVTMITGDWIGPEVCAATREIIAAAGVDVHWDIHRIEEGRITEPLLNACRQSGVVLKARTSSQRSPGRLSTTVELRKKLGLWATVRPVKTLVPSLAKFPETDLLIIRETSEDIYSGFEHTVTAGVYEAVKVTTQAACERISRFGFEAARQYQRNKVTIVHKSNIMKKSDGLFLKTALDVAKDFSDIEVEQVIVDALCMRLVRNPADFDVLLTLNLFGDIVSDLCSGLAGGITASPSASYGTGISLFETIHGRAPELVGQDRCNPIPMLNVARMMLEHLGEGVAANRIHQATLVAISEGVTTPDMGGKCGTREMIQTIADAL